MNTFSKYIKEIEFYLQSDNATEHTYRPILKSLIESFATEINAINEPKRIKCGAPDFLVFQKQQTIGYIEAKNIGTSLNKAEKTTQLTRYFKSLGNLILTDHIEFRWYIKGEQSLKAKIAKLSKNKKQLTPDLEGIEQTKQIFQKFLNINIPLVKTPQELATRMANIAQLIREAIATALNDEDKGGTLRDQLESFQNVLLKDLTKNKFADMYAQTICYGLFAARCNCDIPDNFSRWVAARDLPKTNPFLRNIFGQIVGTELDERIAWAVDDLAELLKHTDMTEILQDFGKKTRKSDPVVHFYETFLTAYDPKMRKSRGVYYTPEPVVNYIVRSVDYILKNKFDIPKGLADANKIKISHPNQKGNIDSNQEIHQVLILDPAVGTGTFMYAVISHIYESFLQQKGMWSSYVSQHLLPRLFGFELLMAPYTVAHMKLGLQLQELGYKFDSDERLRIYLTNTLQEAFQLEKQVIGFATRIKEEAENAKEIKQELPVMIILGNPPYAYESENTDPWIINLVRDYYQIDGKPLGEKNPKGLLDDYVKFIRFSQCQIEKTGYGVLAFITNHGYLDNPTFRGMRQSLMTTFDEIYVLDLHGNSKKKEVSPDGSPDQNVFDIQQGVAIGIFIKLPRKSQKLAKVYHADLWGVRELFEDTSTGKKLIAGKYHWLEENDIYSTEWEVLKPQSKFYLFKPQNIDFLSEYEQFWKVTEIFPTHSVGVITARDNLTIHFTEKDIWNTVNKFVNLSVESARNEYNLGKDTRDWKVDLAQKDLKKSEISQSNITPILYRPFDKRYTYYTGRSRGFHCTPRGEVMKHFLAGENLGLITTRQQSQPGNWHLFGVTENIIESCAISNKTKEINYLFPLYLYPDTPGEKQLGIGRRANLAPEFVQDFSKRLKMKFIIDSKDSKKQTFRAEDIFNYIYAIFHSPTYRSRYSEFLKIDFPHIPLTNNPELFFQLIKIGDRLINLHLMKITASEISSYP
ncbi:type ISP restriction/modification enzyme, partial [Okeania sp.]|uniref:type ISP restriction/modification enzyme n=1 Tax=Okeania sp. TaxID=3100323 RepID=UPI002B4B84C4